MIFLFGPALQPKSGVYTVGEFMTRKEDLHVVKPTTTVDEGICNKNIICWSTPYYFHPLIWYCLANSFGNSGGTQNYRLSCN